MILNRVLIDTNICLDSALQHTPFDIPAAKVLSLSELNIISGFVAAHTFDAIFYLLKKSYSTVQSYESIETLRETIQIVDVTETVIDDATNLKWNDFEDAIHYQAALSAGCECIVTRNENDFKKSVLPVFSPQTFLDLLDR